jgi:EmrB/QacA subfamily drug resistance transporter
MTTADGEPAEGRPDYGAWPALWALCLGFFMIMIDTTIVSVATPAIMEGLHTDVNTVIWVTSAYLLSYAVPLLITGRLGDRFGPKNLYIGGLVIFTLASAWCGFTGTAEQLIIARAIQGLGAAMMTPQTMAVITRIFPATNRGQAMGMWGAVAGVAILVGPLLGGVLIDALGWEWIFFINVPIGVVGVALAWRLVPDLPTNPHRFDIVGVGLSAAGMFLLVFGIQEGQSYDWSALIWGLIIAGVAVLALSCTGSTATPASPCCRSRCSVTATSRWPTPRSRRSASRSRPLASRSCCMRKRCWGSARPDRRCCSSQWR